MSDTRNNIGTTAAINEFKKSLEDYYQYESFGAPQEGDALLLNDTKNNKAISPYSLSTNSNNVAGGKGFKILDWIPTYHPDTHTGPAYTEAKVKVENTNNVQKLSDAINRKYDVDLTWPDSRIDIFKDDLTSIGNTHVYNVTAVGSDTPTNGTLYSFDIGSELLLLFHENGGENPQNIPFNEIDKTTQVIVTKVSNELEDLPSRYKYKIVIPDTPMFSLYLSNPPFEGPLWGNVDYYGKIIEVDTVNSLITLNGEFQADHGPYIDENATLIIPEYATIGDTDIGSCATSSGYGTRAIRVGSNSEGYNTLASGKYSHSQNLDNIAGGYASDAGGWGNKALTQASFVRGKNNTLHKYANYSAAFGEGHDIMWEHNFYVGKFGDNRSPRLFAVGMGTDANNRKNALEVTQDGMLMIAKAGSSGHYNSVPQMWQLDLKAPLNNPAFTGTPTAPTPEKNDSSDKIATTSFVMTALSDINVDVDLTNYVTKTNLTTTLDSYVKRNPWIVQKDGWMDILRYVDLNVIDPEEGGIDELYTCKATTNINGKSALEFNETSAKVILTQTLPDNMNVIGVPFALVYDEDGVLSMCDIQVVNTIQLATKTEVAPIQHSMQKYIIDLGSFGCDENTSDKIFETGIYTIDKITKLTDTSNPVYRIHFSEGFFFDDEGSYYYDKLDHSIFTEGMRLNVTFIKSTSGYVYPTVPVDISIVLDIQDYINIRSMEARIGQIEKALDEIIAIQNTLVNGEN